ncbi:hypothetical protein CLU79DRAFT_891992 [Phycomyces nitens]|nr:hypothetical protein CLU79DRAFT_891992 [Phycomyces nitens]
MKFTLIATATMALIGMVSAIHPVHSCIRFHVANPGESCNAISNQYSVSIDNLRKWNHGLTHNHKDRCATLFPGVPYCVLATKPKITRSLFKKRASKSSSKDKKKVTKKVQKKPKKAKKTTKKTTKKSAKKTKKTTKKTTKKASHAGLNIANRTDPNCKKYHVVKSTDSCYSVAKANKISMNKFYSLNAGLHHLGDHICDNLDTGKAYCVAV